MYKRTVPAMTVSLRLYLEHAFGKSFSFRLLNLNSPLWFASSNILSNDLVNWFCKCPPAFVTNTAMLHGFSPSSPQLHSHQTEFIIFVCVCWARLNLLDSIDGTTLWKCFTFFTEIPKLLIIFVQITNAPMIWHCIRLPTYLIIIIRKMTTEGETTK